MAQRLVVVSLHGRSRSVELVGNQVDLALVEESFRLTLRALLLLRLVVVAHLLRNDGIIHAVGDHGLRGILPLSFDVVHHAIGRRHTNALAASQRALKVRLLNFRQSQLCSFILL